MREGAFPTIGSWISYGLGALNQNLPQYVVLGTPTGPEGFAYSLLDTGNSINLIVSEIPEPGCAVLLTIALAILPLARRRS